MKIFPQFELMQPEPSRVRHPQVHKAAQLYEDQFLREMVKAMRRGIPESGFIKKNMGERIYREQLDHRYVEAWVQHGGVGLTDLIYKNLMNQSQQK